MMIANWYLYNNNYSLSEVSYNASARDWFVLGGGEEQGLGSKMGIQPRLQDENFAARSKNFNHPCMYSPI